MLPSIVNLRDGEKLKRGSSRGRIYFKFKQFGANACDDSTLFRPSYPLYSYFPIQISRCVWVMLEVVMGVGCWVWIGAVGGVALSVGAKLLQIMCSHRLRRWLPPFFIFLLLFAACGVLSSHILPHPSGNKSTETEVAMEMEMLNNGANDAKPSPASPKGVKRPSRQKNYEKSQKC